MIDLGISLMQREQRHHETRCAEPALRRMVIDHGLLHRMHHADTALDATSGARFHPVEIALSMLIKSAMVLIIGASRRDVQN